MESHSEKKLQYHIANITGERYYPFLNGISGALPNSGKILDAGCASGLNLHLLQDAMPYCEIIGCDVKVDPNTSLPIAQMDMYKLTTPIDDPFSMIVMANNFSYSLTKLNKIEEIAAHLKSAWQRLKEGGLLSIWSNYAGRPNINILKQDNHAVSLWDDSAREEFLIKIFGQEQTTTLGDEYINTLGLVANKDSLIPSTQVATRVSEIHLPKVLDALNLIY